MLLTKKGKKIMASMIDTYGSKEKAQRVFYAAANKGSIKGIDFKRKRR